MFPLLGSSTVGRIPLVFHGWNPPPLAFPVVTGPEESRALMNLADLLSKDLSKVDAEELAAGVRDAETTGDQAPEWSSRLIQALRDQGVSWSQMVKLTGLPQTTLWRRVNKRD